MLEGHATLKGSLGQHSLTKAVDGIDGRLVKPLQSVVEFLACLGPVRIGRHQVLVERVFGLLSTECIVRFYEASTNPIP